MGLLDIFKKGLTNTRNFFAGGFKKIAASTGHFDEDMLDELEELMIRADCGVPASEDIIDRVKEDIKKTGDDSHLGLWIALMMLSLLGIAASLIFGKKKRVFDR